MTYRIALVGYGKIARDAHVPAIAASDSFELVAIADPSTDAPAGVAGFRDHHTLLCAPLAFDAVAICTPPAMRHDIAAAALAAGKDVLLEKPPAATPDHLADLAARALRHGRVLFTAWHSRHHAAVEQARIWLAGRQVTGLAIDWQEDVRRWHPGQDWIWRAGGFGVFDPGINALSIATAILPQPLTIRHAALSFVAGTEAPIAADIAFDGEPGQAMRAVFDWRPIAEDIREIAVTTQDGHRLRLAKSGACLEVDGDTLVDAPAAEYAGLYARFASLLRCRVSDVDGRPLSLAADALRLGRRETI